MKITNEILDAINRADTVLVCGHIRPDGDCIGSALAMRRICEKLGKKADAVCDAEDKPEQYAFLPDYDKFCVSRFEKYDLFIAVDCATEKRLGAYRSKLLKAKNSIYIDHHPSAERYANINYIDPSASSTCAIIYEIFDAAGLIDKETATMLYTGLSTDTGHFMHSNTDAKVFGIAQGLCKYGIDVGDINHSVYCNRSPQKIKLMSRVLDGIRFYEDGKISVMTITLDDLSASGCGADDTEGLIDFAKSVSGVEIAVSVCEQPNATFRVSYRSVRADVSKAAAVFGGGGHKLAAGCIISGNRYDVIEKVISAAKTVLREIG